MLGGIVASFFMFAPMVTLFAALGLLIGMVLLGAVGLMTPKEKPEVAFTVPRMEKAS